MSQDSSPEIQAREAKNSLPFKSQHLRFGHALAGHHNGALKRHMEKRINTDELALQRRGELGDSRFIFA